MRLTAVLLLALASCTRLAFEPLGAAPQQQEPDAGSPLQPPAPDAGTPPGPCEDARQDGTETDVDCGGVCAKCAIDKACQRATDCASDACIGGHCRPASECTITEGQLCTLAHRSCGPLQQVDSCGRAHAISSCGTCAAARECEDGACTCAWHTSVIDPNGGVSTALTRAGDGTLHAIAVRDDGVTITHAARDAGAWAVEAVQVADPTWRTTHQWQPGATLFSTDSGPGGDTLTMSGGALYPSTGMMRVWSFSYSPAAGGWTGTKSYWQGDLQVKSGPQNATAAHGRDAWIAYRVADPNLPASIRVQYLGPTTTITSTFDLDDAWPTALAIDFSPSDPQVFDLVWASVDGKLHAAHAQRDAAHVTVASDVVVGAGSVGTMVSAARDDAGWLHVAYFDELRNEARTVVRPAGGLWRESAPVDSGNAQASADLAFAVEPSGGEHLAFYDRANQRLKYASRRSVDDPWQVEAIDAGADVGRAPSLVVTSDAVHVVYLDTAHEQLKYATRCR